MRISVGRIALGECALGGMHTDFGTGGFLTSCSNEGNEDNDVTKILFGFLNS